MAAAEKAEDEVAAAIAGAERKEEIEVAAAGRGKDNYYIFHFTDSRPGWLCR